MIDTDKILEFAKKAHEGQFRKRSKEPYIRHCIQVAANAVKLSEIMHVAIPNDVILTTAYLHDVIEDTPTKYSDVEKLLDESGCSDYYKQRIMVALTLLTKQPGMSDYDIIDYTTSIRRNPLACLIKIADIDHNTSDLDSGNLKQKYFLQRYILTH